MNSIATTIPNICNDLDETPMMNLSSSFLMDLDPQQDQEGPYQSSISSFFQGSNDLTNVMNILESAENVLNMEDDEQADDEQDYTNLEFSLEPTPIGPCGVDRLFLPKASDNFLAPMEVNSLPGMTMMKSYPMPTLKEASYNPMSSNRPYKRQRTTANFAEVLPFSIFSMGPPPPPTTQVTPDMKVSKKKKDATSKKSENDGTVKRFRTYQADQWQERFEDLVEFKAEHGHCLVPHNYPPNQQLAQWTKRQRYQYKLKNLGRHSTLTEERHDELEKMGFVWDSHRAAWSEQYQALQEYKEKYGHCNVPAKFADNKPLAVWVKCQRRQMKLYKKGAKSTMTEERTLALQALGFDWNPRNL